MRILNCSDLNNPILEGVVDTGAEIVGLATGSLYTAEGWAGISIYDDTIPTNPVPLISSGTSSRRACDILHAANYVYVAENSWNADSGSYDGWLELFETDGVSTLSSLSVTPVMNGWQQKLTIWSNVVFTTSGDWDAEGITSVDTTDPLNPIPHHILSGVRFVDVAVDSNYLYAATDYPNGPLSLYRIDSATNLVKVHISGDFNDSGCAVRLHGNMIVVATWGGVCIYENRGGDLGQNGLPDWWEMTYFETTNVDATADEDSDGVSNLGEYQAGTNPLLDNDQDMDGLRDADEILIYNSSPNLTDSDYDGISDLEEVTVGVDGYTTRPDKWDTDDDAMDDGIEIDIGRNPVDPSDGGDGRIQGRVFRADGVTPVTSGSLSAISWSGWKFYCNASIGSDGSYWLWSLPPGDYKLRVDNPPLGLSPEYYDGGHDGENATKLSLGSDQIISGVDFTLDPGGAIQGHVYDATNMSPIERANVHAWPPGTIAGGFGGYTDSNGYFLIYVPVGACKVRANTDAGSYVEQYYNGKSGFSDADEVMVDEGVSVSFDEI
jgi:hypothetical protein